MKLNIVPAARGIQWVKLGLQTFMKQPLALAALIFMYMTVGGLMLLIPYIGALLMVAIVPMGTLGLMAATKVAETNTFPMPAVLLTAFRASRERVRAMFVLGVLYAAAVVVIALLLRLLVDVPNVAGKDAAEIAQTPGVAQALMSTMLLAGVLYLPVSLAFWHAPALVHWYGVPPIKSLFFSFVACLRNAGAFTMYALSWVGVVVVIVVGSELAAFVSPWLSGVVFGAASTIATIAFYISIWFTFRDSFLEEEGNPGDSP
jgi:hypothetical protein